MIGLSLLGQVVLTDEMTLDKAIQIALLNNREYNAYKLKLDQSKALLSSAFSLDKTNFFVGYDRNNVADNGYPLNIIGVEQSFSFPTVYSAQYQVNKSSISMSEKELERQKLFLTMNVSKAYYKLIYLMNKEMHYKILDSLYRNFALDSESKFKRGDIGNLERMNANARYQQVKLSLNSLKYEKEEACQRLNLLLHAETRIMVPYEPLRELELHETDLESDPGLQYRKLETQQQKELVKLEKNRLLPDISLTFYNGTNRFADAQNYRGYEIGISVPLFFAGDKSRIKATEIGVAISKNMEENYLIDINLKIAKLKSELKKYRESLDYYHTTGRALSSEIITSSQKSYKMGEIDSYQLVQSMENAMIIEVEYIDWLMQYNDIVLELNYLTM
ncbi:MAG: hypothetical protein A2X18_02065 [Bacteroidetes bacterium GWF2_40_14]|nr:MAG: hypothetical protein A2X18_02065 [Bacteroidetes bacterium GWF2_40_14]